ncbi:Transcriptional activator hac1 [Zalerion maritima]|uniref:Transcriptional activator hac1 n=1 Tax=Zalerion maritima TaxID=339359 RepID=A0AAD5RKN3_9PEZI|nr:Transcriptional activator hac1 [Zalerion maritima]
MDHLQQAQGRPQMATPTATPVLKLEHSPSDSLMSLPATTEFSPLFPATSDAADTPERDLSLEAMTPQSGPASPSPIPDSDLLESFSLPLIDPPLPTTTHAEKKAAKKRKSWGQVLPEPKTNLPPRKRAKTDDEKEQRRVERVLRNRRAAQSSRERKRAETEKLEMRNRELESKVATLQRSNMFLLDTLKQAKAGGQLHIDSPALEALINNPTLGRSVFPATDQPPSSASSSSMGNFGARDATVDPARLSPGLTPIPEDQPLSETSAKESYSGVREPSGVVRPAVSVGGGVLGTESRLPSTLDPNSGVDPLTEFGDFDGSFLFDESSLASRLLHEGGYISSPESTNLEFDNLDGDAASSFLDQFLHQDAGLDNNNNNMGAEQDILFQQLPTAGGSNDQAEPSSNSLFSNTQVQVS